MIWFEETYIGDLLQKLQVDRLVHRERTDHQDLVIFDNPMCGRVLALDGTVQTTERDEFVYHEMLVHPALFAHGHAKNVLIVGGGDGGALEEALKHPVQRVTLVEIDDTVVELSKRHLRAICRDAFEDPRTQLVIADGAQFARDTEQRFDLIIVDSTDPVGPGRALFDPDFYAACEGCLEPDGILITQSGVPWVQRQELRDSVANLGRIFDDATCYLAPVPTYNGGFMAFGWASRTREHRQLSDRELQERYTAAELDTRYYNPEIHRACFALPNFVREIISEPGR